MEPESSSPYSQVPAIVNKNSMKNLTGSNEAYTQSNETAFVNRICCFQLKVFKLFLVYEL